MAKVYSDFFLPRPGFAFVAEQGLFSAVIEATGEKFAWVGPVFTGGSAKSIRKVGFMSGTVTSAGGSQMRLSLQNVDPSTAGLVPDGTQDQYVDFLLSALTSNTVYTTGSLSADRSVTDGEMLAVVVEFDAGGRLGSDALNLRNFAQYGDDPYGSVSNCSLYTASWATQSRAPNIFFEFSDASIGSFYGGSGAVDFSATGNFNSGSATDEYGMAFTPPYDCDVNGIYIIADVAAAGVVRLNLSQNTTVLAYADVDCSQLAGVTNARVAGAIATQSLAAGTEYIVSIAPDANNAAIIRVNGTMGRIPSIYGLSVRAATRADAGAWSYSSTPVPRAGVHVCAIHDRGGAYVIGG